MIKIEIDDFINAKEILLENEIKTNIEKLNQLLHLNKGKKTSNISIKKQH